MQGGKVLSFFNPGFSLFKKRVGETEYGLGWIPFGGYVKISGMIDESMDKDQLKQAPQPWEFRSKPAWQRLIIMVGGVFVNLVLGFLIYAIMLWYWGDSYIPTNKLKYGIATDSLAQSIGLRDGDNILGVDGRYIEKFRKIPLEVILKDAKSIQVDRAGEKMDVTIPGDFAGKLIRYKAIGFIDVRMPFVGLDSVVAGSAAGKAGLSKNDKVLSVNGVRTVFFSDFKNEITKSKNKQVSLLVLRSGDTLRKQATVPGDGILGITALQPKDEIEVVTTRYSFLSLFLQGLTEVLKRYNLTGCSLSLSSLKK